MPARDAQPNAAGSCGRVPSLLIACCAVRESGDSTVEFVLLFAIVTKASGPFTLVIMLSNLGHVDNPMERGHETPRGQLSEIVAKREGIPHRSAKSYRDLADQMRAML